MDHAHQIEMFSEEEIRRLRALLISEPEEIEAEKRYQEIVEALKSNPQTVEKSNIVHLL